MIPQVVISEHRIDNTSLSCDYHQDIKSYARCKVTDAFVSDEWGAFEYLVHKESSWRPEAQNPKSTAYGLMQFLDSTWATVGCEKTSDPKKQIDCGIDYIIDRYGTPTKAKVFHNQNNWY